MSIFCPEEWVEKHNVLHIKLFSSDVRNVNWLFWKVWTAWVYSRGCLQTHTHHVKFSASVKINHSLAFQSYRSTNAESQKKLCMYSSLAPSIPTIQLLIAYSIKTDEQELTVHWKASEWGNRSNTVDRRGQISCIYNKIYFGLPVLTKWASLEHKACTITLPWQQTAVVWQFRVYI